MNRPQFKRALTLEDVIEVITDFGSMIIEQIDELSTRMDRLEYRMTTQEIAQCETNLRLGKVEGELKANGNDIKELYTLVA